MEDWHIRSVGHLDLADLPMHSFGRPPRERHLLRNLLPHVLLEPGRDCQCRSLCDRGCDLLTFHTNEPVCSSSLRPTLNAAPDSSESAGGS